MLLAHFSRNLLKLKLPSGHSSRLLVLHLALRQGGDKAVFYLL